MPPTSRLHHSAITQCPLPLLLPLNQPRCHETRVLQVVALAKAPSLTPDHNRYPQRLKYRHVRGQSAAVCLVFLLTILHLQPVLLIVSFFSRSPTCARLDAPFQFGLYLLINQFLSLSNINNL